LGATFVFAWGLAARRFVATGRCAGEAATVVRAAWGATAAAAVGVDACGSTTVAVAPACGSTTVAVAPVDVFDACGGTAVEGAAIAVDARGATTGALLPDRCESTTVAVAVLDMCTSTGVAVPEAVEDAAVAVCASIAVEDAAVEGAAVAVCDSMAVEDASVEGAAVAVLVACGSTAVAAAMDDGGALSVVGAVAAVRRASRSRPVSCSNGLVSSESAIGWARAGSVEAMLGRVNTGMAISAPTATTAEITMTIAPIQVRLGARTAAVASWCKAEAVSTASSAGNGATICVGSARGRRLATTIGGGGVRGGTRLAAARLTAVDDGRSALSLGAIGGDTRSLRPSFVFAAIDVPPHEQRQDDQWGGASRWSQICLPTCAR
jgi:hypothetical protein